MKTIEQRIQEKIVIENGCHVFYGAGSSKGHPVMTVNGKTRSVPRIVANVTDKSLHVTHSCGNRSCVNPEHLEVMDSVKSYRKPRKTYKLNNIIAQEIREAYSNGATMTQLADKYGCSEVNIHYVIKGKIWNHDNPDQVTRDSGESG